MKTEEPTAPEFKTAEVEPIEIESAKPEPNTAVVLEPEPVEIEPDFPYAPNEPEAVKNEFNVPVSVESDPNEPEGVTIEEAEPELSDDSNSAISFHDKCTSIFNNYVDDKGMVNYRKLRRQRLKLKAIMIEFYQLDREEYESWSREDKIAFWINAYNIQMLSIIVENYPIKSSALLRTFWPADSIRHIPPTGKIGVEKWADYKFIVMDEEFTLPEIEKRFFRKEFKEPRVFLVLSHATKSGPPLRNEPYYGDRLYKQLDEQVGKFLANPLAFKIDRRKKIVYLSSIFEPAADSYGSEFLEKYSIDRKFKDQPPVMRAVLNFISGYLPEQDVSFLEVGNYSVSFIRYDWTINED